MESSDSGRSGARDDASAEAARPKRAMFRSQAQRGRTEPLDGLLRVTAPHEWVLLAALAAALGGVVAWGALGGLDRSVSGSCVVVSTGRAVVVVAETSGVVSESLVQPGEAVAPGAPIVRLAGAGLEPHLAAAEARLGALESAGAGTEALAVAQAELALLRERQALGSVIRSPVAGEVASLGPVPGDAVVAGEALARIWIAGDGHEVLARTDDATAGRLRPGRRATITVEAPRSGDPRHFDAVLSAISPGPEALPARLHSRLGPVAAADFEQARILRLAPSDELPAPLTEGDVCTFSVPD